ncbi:type II secretion system F family protein [Janthinobacterium sp. RT4P48]|uniref:type II secretion system F family protein n=1 Tax=Janthinobacterium sp. RT4P48 TaxID=3424188 RepID=UPI003F20BED3
MALLLLFGALVFAAALLLSAGLYLLWRGMRNRAPGRLAQRVRNASGGDAGGGTLLSISKRRLLSQQPLLQQLLERLPPAGALDRLMLQAGSGQTVAQVLGWSVLALLAGLAAGALLGLALPLQLGLGALGAALPCWRLLRARQRRLARIEQQLPEALDLMGRSMRAGHAFPTALKMVGDELRAPLGSEMRIVFDEVNFGVAMGDALGNLASRVPSTDLRYFVVAVLIQRETGGNLAELLGRISAIIRDRLTLLGEIRTLSAEGRMSAWILSLMPFAVALMMQLSSPDFLRLLYTDPGGRKMLTMALVMMGLGILVIRKVTRIRL